MLSSFCHVQLFFGKQLFFGQLSVAHQAPLPIGFFRHEYLSDFTWPYTGDLPGPGIQPSSLTFPALAGGLFTTSSNWEALIKAQS